MSPRSSLFTCRCPNTGYYVQGSASTKTSDGACETVACIICGGVHLIDLATGKMLGEEKNRTLQFQKQRAEDQCLWTEYTHRSHKVMRYDQFRASS